MHRKQGSDLIPADTELERTLRSLRKTKRAENAAMAEERHEQTEEQRTADECLKHSSYTRVSLPFSCLFYSNFIVFATRILI